jgi:hypothetical protein
MGAEEDRRSRGRFLNVPYQVHSKAVNSKQMSTQTDFHPDFQTKA